MEQHLQLKLPTQTYVSFSSSMLAVLSSVCLRVEYSCVWVTRIGENVPKSTTRAVLTRIQELERVRQRLAYSSYDRLSREIIRFNTRYNAEWQPEKVKR